LANAFQSVLRSLPTPEPRTRGAGALRFTKEDVQAAYEARKAGHTWKTINRVLSETEGGGYTREASLAQAMHNAAKHFAIEPPFPAQHRTKKKSDKTLVGV
jgi:hypothetical protein